MSEGTEHFEKGMSERRERCTSHRGYRPPASILRDLLSSQTSLARNLHGSAAERELGVLEGGEAPQLHPRERTGPDWPAPNGNAVNIHVYSQVLFTRPCDIAGQNESRTGVWLTNVMEKAGDDGTLVVRRAAHRTFWCCLYIKWNMQGVY